jgi:hypothetical protein
MTRTLQERRVVSRMALALWLALAAAALPAAAAEEALRERLQVSAPFVELHTGPGRGYPVFFVVEKRQWIEIELRRTDWYRVRTEGGKVGWVQRAQLDSTITVAGGQKSFRDLVLDDYLARRLELGAAYGRFKGEPMLKFWTGYRLSDTLGVEATLGQVQGVFSGTEFWHVNLNAEPWSDRRLSPFFTVGLGKFKNIPNTSLVSADVTNAKLGHAGVGLRWHISDRFIARADYSVYSAFVSDARTIEYRAVTVGLAFYF